MRRTSQASFDSVVDAFQPVLTQAGEQAATLGEQMFAVVDALDSSGSLRRALSDPSRPAQDKAGLVRDLFGGKIDDRAVEALSGLVRARWSAEGDLADAVHRLAVEAVLAAAESAGALGQVEEELFRFDRILAAERELRIAVGDRRAASEDRAALVRGLVTGKMHALTELLVVRSAAKPRGRTVTASMVQLVEAASNRRKRLVARVTAAVPLTSAQLERVRGLLDRAYGHGVNVHVAVDPAVVGGMRIQVGDDVVDATVLSSLEDARRRLAG